jgi:hypothetical protein
LHNGIKTILNECEKNLTYLNVYRKNHLKQLLNFHAPNVENVENNSVQITPNKSISFNLIEEALQAKTK